MDKILSYSPNEWGDKCLICGENQTPRMVTINRKCCDSSVTSFAICEECLRQIGNEIDSELPQVKE